MSRSRQRRLIVRDDTLSSGPCRVATPAGSGTWNPRRRRANERLEGCHVLPIRERQPRPAPVRRGRRCDRGPAERRQLRDAGDRVTPEEARAGPDTGGALTGRSLPPRLHSTGRAFPAALPRRSSMSRDLLASLGLAFCFVVVGRADDPKQAHEAVKPAERLEQDWWKKRHDRFVARAKEGGVDVLFLGDSITEGWESNGKKVWEDHFAPLKAANFGISGDRTQHVFWRITEGKELDGIDPKAAVLMIGTNNAGSNTAKEIAEGVEAIVKELRRQKPKTKVLVLGVFPRGGKRREKEQTEVKAEDLHPKIKQINAILAKLDDGKA